MILKYLLISILICFTSVLNIGDEVTKIATQQVKELDEILILIDPNAALSHEQKQLTLQLFVEKIEKTREIKASNDANTSERIAELMQNIADRLHNDILTKNQREAKFEYQKNYQSK